MILLATRTPRLVKPAGACRFGRCQHAGTIHLSIRWPAAPARVVRVCRGHEQRAYDVARALSACAEVSVREVLS